MHSVVKVLVLLCSLTSTRFGSDWTSVVDGYVVSSTTKFHSFATLDLAAGLDKYIQHETQRLEIIKVARGWEEEVPVVKVRLQKLQNLSQQFAARKAEYGRLVENLNDFHPITALRLLSDYLDTWGSQVQNDTVYGFRFAEFLSNDDDSKLPRETDLQLAARAVVEIQYIHNLTTADIYSGNILGHKGTPLRPRDAYQVAKSASDLRHLRQALWWYETALNNTPAEEFSAKSIHNASYPVTVALAQLGVLHYGMDEKKKGVELLERASNLDPEDDDIRRLYLSHRSGSDVPPLVHSELGDFSFNWFRLCANASRAVLNPVKSYHVCRYRYSSVVRYRRYREEVLSRSPFLSILHDFLPAPQARQLINVSSSKLMDGRIIEGIGSSLVLAEGAVLNHSVAEARLLSERISDVTGLSTEERPLRGSGEPLHVFNYGLSGAFLPHYDVNRMYGNKYTMRRSGHRMATILVYLSDVTEGGATAFPYLNITVQPQAGKALLWYNTDPKGRAERKIIHAGCSVAVGAKWVASKGVWSLGNELRRPCGPNVTSSHMAVDRIATRPPAQLRTEK